MTAESGLWTPLQLYTQRRVRELSVAIGNDPRLVSDARYVSLYLEADTDPALAAEAVETFGRVMIHGPRDAVMCAAEALTLDDFSVLRGLSCISGTADGIAEAARKFLEDFSAPSGLSCYALNDLCSDEDVRTIQRLQLAGDLVPLPRAGLFDPRSVAMVLRNAASEVIGFSSVFDLEVMGARAGWYQVGGVCIADSYRRLGLGTYMTAKVLLQAIEQWNAQTFIGSVHEENVASVKMHRACGMHIDADSAFIFARISHQQEMALLGTS